MKVDAHLDEIRRKYIAAPLAEAFKAGLEAGFREGAAAMREAAATYAHAQWKSPHYENAIRALPLPEPK